MKQGNIIGKRIRLVRELRRLTQQQFARNFAPRATMSVVTSWRAGTMRTPVTDTRMLGIATVLRVPFGSVSPRDGTARIF